MKKIFLLTSIILIVFSCASGPADNRNTESMEQMKEPKLVSALAPRLLKTVSYFPDGDIDEITVYSYAEKSVQPLKEETYDAYEALQGTVINKYEDGNIDRSEYYDSYNSLVSAKKYEFDGMRNMVSESFLDDTGTVTLVFEYEYDESGNKVQWKVNSPVTGLLAITEYVYSKEQLVSINSYDAGGEKAESFSYDYNRENADTFSHFDSADKLMNYSKFEYDNGNHIVRQIKYRTNNTVNISIDFRYDKEGNLVEKTVYDSKGNIKQRYSYEYEMIQAEIWTREY
jgi:hypothetical protein